MGDVLRSRLCRCGRRLADAMDEISALGRGVIVHLRDPSTGLLRRPTRLSREPLLVDRCSAGDAETSDELVAGILDDLGFADPDLADLRDAEIVVLDRPSHGREYAPDLVGAAS